MASDVEQLPRKLAAILYADVAGYSRLTGEDEEGTHLVLRRYLDLVSSTIQSYNGRVVHYAGDAVLADFSTVVEALSCAAAMQCKLADKNKELPDDRRVRFRVGVNLGDVIVDGEEIYGDGVNVAARLESLSEPGGICVSEAARAAAGSKLPLDFDFMGEQQVKNIAQPVRAYRACLKVEAQLPAPAEQHKLVKQSKTTPWKWQILVAVLAIVAAVAAGALAWIKPWRPWEGLASMEQMAFPLPGKPSIVVLPFKNISDEPSQEYFADGMTEDLITDLSKISGLFVIARNSSFIYKDQVVTVRKVAEDLGVRYVLEGSVRRIGDEVRINTQLVDATTGGHVWADRYDRKLDNIFVVQDEIMERVVRALEPYLTDTEQKHLDKLPKTTSLEAYDLVLQARKLLTRFDHSAASEARDLLQRAIEMDPAYTEAHSLLGFYYFDEWRVWGQKRDQNLARALELGITAVELDPSDPAPHVLLALVYQWRREFDAANAAADTALALQPNDAITLSNLGSMLNWAGRSEEALELLRQAIRLDPFHPPNYLERLGAAYAGVGDYEQCVEVTRRGVALNPNYVGLYVDLAGCYAALGREKEARAAAAEILRTNPRFTLKAFASYVPYSDERDLQREVQMLRKAGIPESTSDVFRMAKGHMTGEEIRRAVSGQTYVDTLPELFAGTTMTFHPSGSMDGQPQIGSSAEQFGRDQGRWWTEGDKFCRKWNRWVSGRAGCFSFLPSGDSIRWINRYGEFHSEMKRLE